VLHSSAAGVANGNFPFSAHDAVTAHQLNGRGAFFLHLPGSGSPQWHPAQAAVYESSVAWLRSDLVASLGVIKDAPNVPTPWGEHVLTAPPCEEARGAGWPTQWPRP
jgi:hypothetical protein